MSDPLLVVVVGPTASGKTALSVAVAERFQGEIVNSDSVAVYRGFQIGTAKPSAEERSRAPHHLLDILEPSEVFTAGDYARLAREALFQIRERGHLPLVVGGTGLYLRALLEGLFPGPPRFEDLRRRLKDRARQRDGGYLHRLLRRLDPQAAMNIHPNDEPKIIRAVEVCLTARKPMTEMWKQGRDPLRGFRILRFGLHPERNALYARINRRANAMFDQGLVEETRRLLETYGEAARPLNSLGYRQALRYLRGESNLKRAIWAAQQAHRNYAKRQMTWFRREPDVHWLRGFGDQAEIQAEAISRVQAGI